MLCLPQAQGIGSHWKEDGRGGIKLVSGGAAGVVGSLQGSWEVTGSPGQAGTPLQPMVPRESSKKPPARTENKREKTLNNAFLRFLKILI